MRKNFYSILFSVIGIMLFLSACGGGGGSDRSQTSVNAPSDNTEATENPPTDAATADTSGITTPTELALTKIEINTVSGEVKVTPGVKDKKIYYLVNNSLPVEETVIDKDGNLLPGYSIAWNDGDSWYPAAGVVAALALPATTIPGAAKTSGASSGMPYLVFPDKTFMSFNTSMCKVFVNGIDVTSTAINTNGLITYSVQ